MRGTDLLGGRGAEGATALQALALVPPLAVILWERGPGALPLAVAAFVIVLAWDAVFATLRHRRMVPHGVTTAAIFVVLAPVELSLWQIVVVLSLGTALGELIFGGRGFGFLPAAAVALSLTVLSAPGAALPATGTAVALATLPGAALLLWAGLLPWRVALAFLAVLAVMAGDVGEAVALAAAAAFVLVFLVCDPVASAATGLGRLAQGAVAGGLVGILGTPGVAQPEALVFAALLASLFAPLLDEGAIALGIWRRRRRHG